MSIDKKRWIILAAACIANLCLGSVYAWSVFASSLAEYFGTLGMNITVGDLAIVYTVANSVGPITMISGGWFNDRLGPKKVILIGGIMFGGGMILAGFAKNVSVLLLTYGLIGGLGLGMAYGTTISTAVKYFPDKRGLTGGLTTAAYGLSSVLVPPVVTLIVKKASVTAAFKLIGAAFLIIIVVCTIFMEQCPDGYMPKGYIPQKTGDSTGNDKKWNEMLKSPVFYIMILLLMSGAFSGMMVISQASGIAQNMIGMSAAMASGAVSILALFNACGRLLAGSISDRIGRINTLVLACVIAIIGLLCLYFSKTGTAATFYLGIAFVGISFGAFMGVFPGFTADQFGSKNNSVNYGIMFIGFAMAGFIGPQIMKTLYASTGAYQPAFLAACGLSVAGILLTFAYRVMNKKQM